MAWGSIPCGGTISKGVNIVVKTNRCPKCDNDFSLKGGNFKKHTDVCNGEYLKPGKSESCKYCGISFDNFSTSKRANHSRWCDLNPKKSEYKTGMGSLKAVAAMNLAKKQEGVAVNHFDKARLEGRPIPPGNQTGKPGNFLGRTHSEETKHLMREKALSSPHRRLKRKMIEYNGVWLDSTWELALAKRLDYLNIKWIRPAPIPWIDNDAVKHNYFADFYLIDYDLFLDPKNPYALKVQTSKLDCLLLQYKNIHIITSLKECEEYNISKFKPLSYNGITLDL